VLDDINLAIVHELRKNARQSSRQIAKKLGIAHTSVQRRANKLIKEDILHIVALPDWEALGYEVWVMVGIKVKYGWTQKVVQTLLQYPAFYSLATALGRFDIIAVGHFQSLSQLNEFIHTELPKVEGIESTETTLMFQPLRYYDIIQK